VFTDDVHAQMQLYREKKITEYSGQAPKRGLGNGVQAAGMPSGGSGYRQTAFQFIPNNLYNR